MGRTATGKLTLKEQTFIDNFFGKHHGNATEAAFAAGYGGTRKSAGELASRLLKKVKVQKAIASRVQARAKASIADADERDEVLTDLLRSAKTKPITRIRAISELNKVTGRHSMTLNHKGKLTLEDAMEASRHV